MCTQTEHHCAQCGLIDTSMPISACPAACTQGNSLWRRRVHVYLEQCHYCLRSTTSRSPSTDIGITLAGSVASPSEEEALDGGHVNGGQPDPVILRTVEEAAWRPTWHHGRGVVRPQMRWRCLVSGVGTASAKVRKGSWPADLKVKRSSRRNPARAREAKEKKPKARKVIVEVRY